MLISLRYFIRRAHSTEQTLFTMAFPSGIQFTAESTEAMPIEFHAQEHNILMQMGIDPSIYVSRNRHPEIACVIKLHLFYSAGI